MSYATVNKCKNDQELQGRVTAACAQEGAAEPEGAMWPMMWTVASAADIEAAYASALAAGNEHPGGDEAVITDGMILGVVQANLPRAVIGDKDPEDAYDAGDPPTVRLEVIERVLEDLRVAELGDRRNLRQLDALRLLRNLAADVDELRARVDVLRDAFEDL